MHLTEVQQLAKEKPIDIAMIAVKSYDTEWATRMIRQYLAPDGYVVSLQNCMNEERIAGIVGWGKTVGAIAGACSRPSSTRRARCAAPWRRAPSHHEVYRVGEVHGRITKRLEELAAMIATVDTVKPTTNLWGERWSKLCVNGMRNGVARRDRPRPATAWTGTTRSAASASVSAARRCASARRSGYELEHIRMHDPETLARAGEGDRSGARRGRIGRCWPRPNSNTRSDLQRPSMGQDMLKGRRTEIDFINGLIAAKGAEVGRPAPTHVKLIAAVKRVTGRAARPAR